MSIQNDIDVKLDQLIDEHIEIFLQNFKKTMLDRNGRKYLVTDVYALRHFVKEAKKLIKEREFKDNYYRTL